MSVQAKRNFMINFSRGFFTPFRSIRILRRNPRLLQYIVIPFLINAIVFSAMSRSSAIWTVTLLSVVR